MSKKKKPCDCKEQPEEYYKGVTFISYQSGTTGEPNEQLMNVFAKFIMDLHKCRIRTYTNMQIGKPGGCPPNGCEE